MIDAIKEYMETYDETTKQRFIILYSLVLESASQEIEEKLWARLPSVYSGSRFVRLVPFEDHINIEAKGVLAHKERLRGYKITPKGMLRIGHRQEIPEDVLRIIFKETLESK